MSYINGEKQLLHRSSFLQERKSSTIEEELSAEIENQWEDVKSIFSGDQPNLENELKNTLENSLISLFDPNVFSEFNWLDFYNRSSNFAGNFEMFKVDISNTVSNIPFSTAIEPLISHGVSEFLSESTVLFKGNEAVANSFAEHIFGQIAEISCFTLYVLVCEYGGTNLNNLEPADNSRVYDDFCKKIAGSCWISVIEEYPVLGRLIATKIRNICVEFEKFSLRFQQDVDRINKKFNSQMDFQGMESSSLFIKDIKFGLSDPHNNGASVFRVLFSNFKSIIYKPKRIENERWFYEDFIPRISSILNTIPTLNILSMDDYGWVEDINSIETSASSDISDEEIIAQISTVALILGATDLHSENVIIRNRQVYIVDLETLFTCPTFIFKSEEEWSNKYIGLNILETGLYKESASFDPTMDEPSGLFDGTVPDRYAYPTFTVYPDGTLRFSKSSQNQSSSSNSGSFDLLNINERKISNHFQKYCRELTSVGSLNSMHSEIGMLITRCVIRPTSFYYRFFQRLLQPRFLKDGAFFSLELYKLYKDSFTLGESASAYIGAIIKSEINQIQRGDIPLFWSESDLRHIFDTNGIVQENYFLRSPSEECKQRINKIDHHFIEENCTLIERSISVARDIRVNRSKSKDKANQIPDSLESSIVDISESLCNDLISDSFLTQTNTTTWVSYFGAVDGKRLFPNSADFSYYGGAIGILTFLTVAENELKTYGRQTNKIAQFLEEEETRIKLNVNQNCEAKIYFPKGAVLGISGAGGILLAASRTLHISSIFSPLVKWIFEDGLQELRKLIEEDEALDIINGSSGFIVGLYSLIKNSPSIIEQYFESIKKIITSLTERLILVAKKSKGKAVWNFKNSSPELLGLSHGGFGLIASLELAKECFKILGLNTNIEIDKVMSKAIDQCQLHRDLQSGLWIDNRTQVEGRGLIVNNSWCHGLTGIGYAHFTKHMSVNYSDDLKLISNKLLNSKTSSLDCYCCGEAGKLDFLITSQLNKFLGQDDTLRDIVEGLVSKWYAEGEFDGIWGKTNPRHFPGLFQGSTGISYTLLRYLNSSLGSLGFEY